MNRASLTTALLIALALSGCASTLSGIGGTNGYACKAPAGAICTSVSGVYANSMHATLVPSKPVNQLLPAAVPANTNEVATAPGSPVSASGESIRSNPRLLRLWIAPWEDADGDLHEESLVHVLVDAGRWLIEHVRPASHSRTQRITPPSPRVEKPAPAKAASEAPPTPEHFPLPSAGTAPGSERVRSER